MAEMKAGEIETAEIKYSVILTFSIKTSIFPLGQPLRKRSPALDRAYSKIPRPRRGKRHHHGGDVCVG